MMKTLYLIDGHSHIYQSFYAIRGLSGPRGEPVNAIYGFAGSLMKLLREAKPDYLAVALDEGAPTFREAAYSEYKAQRRPMPEDLQVQIPVIREMLKYMNIPVLSLPGYEADDVIGTAATKAAGEGLKVVMVTRDKDFRQLLGPNISIYDPKTETTLDEAALLASDKIRPEQVPDVFGLSGDATDNIPGVPGIGPKTALELIRKYGSLEKVLARADEIKGRRGQMLKEHAEEARMSKSLATIERHVPVELDIESFQRGPFDRRALGGLFRRLGFRRFTEELGENEPGEETVRANYQLVDSIDGVERLAGLLREAKSFAVDTETTSVEPMRARLVGISFSWQSGNAWYVPVMGKGLDEKKVLELLRPVLEDPSASKTGQNIKYDMIVLRQAGIALAGVDFDTMVAAYVLDPGGRRFGLDELSLDFLGYRKIPTKDIIGSGASAITMDQAPVEKVCEYSCEDADVTWKLRAILEPKLAQTKLADLFNKLEMPLVPVLAEMERHGIRIDADRLRAMSAQITRKAEELEKEIYAEAGERFNVASPQQLAEILFTKLGLPRLKRTKEGYSTASEVLEQLSRRHPLPGLVLRYRQLMKLKNTYVDALPELVNPQTGRIHASFNQTATATGRLSSSDPNLQNIPIRTELGSRIREAFVPGSPDEVLLTADYSQIELRMMAHYSGDARMVEAFRNGEDIHTVVASEIFRVAPGEVTGELRNRAKAVDFGIIYGLSAYGLAQSTGLSVEEAQTFIDAYFDRYPGVEAFINRVLEEAAQNGFVETILGRRRYIEGIRPVEGRSRNLPERTAINTVIQGSAADLIKTAMVNIHRRIQGEHRPSKLLLQIHDELVFEVAANAADEEMEMVRKEMEGALDLSVPLTVKCACGANWLEAK